MSKFVSGIVTPNGGFDPMLTIKKTGADPSAGVATLVSGVATINTTCARTYSVIILTRNTPGGTVGELYARTSDIAEGVYFMIRSSSASDTSTVNWLLIN